MDPIGIAIILLCIGLALLGIEFFIPSGGLIGVISIICIAVSIFLAYRGWYHTRPRAFFAFLGFVIMMMPITVIGTLWIMPRTRFGKQVLLDAPKLEDVTPFSEEQAKLEKLVGKPGKTVTMLNPGGMVEVEGERFHCESPGLILDPGSDVEVCGVAGNRLVVCPPTVRQPVDLAKQDSGEIEFTSEIASDHNARQSSDDAAPLDFDMPQN